MLAILRKGVRSPWFGRIMLLLFCCLLAAIIVPQYSNYIPRVRLEQSQAYIGGVIKPQIEAYWQQNKHLHGVRAKVHVPPDIQQAADIDFFKITQDGVIIFRQARHHQVIVWEPVIQQDQLVWQCYGFAEQKKDLTGACH